MSEDLWERRYRNLEHQLEALLRRTERKLYELEEVISAQSARLNKVNIDHVTIDKHGTLTCVADGPDLEYRFLLTMGHLALKDTGFQRSNSISLRQPGQLTVEVSVRSAGAPQSTVFESHPVQLA